MYLNTNENMLTISESIIMNTIWLQEEDISVPDLIKNIENYYHKSYARTTVTTFITKLIAKGYVSTYRKGKLSYVVSKISKQEYREFILKEVYQFWYNENKVELENDLKRIME